MKQTSLASSANNYRSRKEYDELYGNFEYFRQQYQQLSISHKYLQVKYRKAQKELVMLKNQVDCFEQDVNLLESATTLLNNREVEIDKHLREEQERNCSLSNLTVALEQELQDTRKILAEDMINIDRHTDIVLKLQRDVDNVRRERDDLHSCISSEYVAKEEYKILQSQIVLLKAEIDAITTRCSLEYVHKNELEKAKEECKILQSQIELLKAEIEAMTNRYCLEYVHKNELEKVQEYLNSIISDKNDIESSLSVVNHQLMECKTLYKRESDLVIQREAEMKQLHGSIREKDIQLCETQFYLQTKTNEVQAVNEKLSACEISRDLIQRQLVELQSKIKHAADCRQSLAHGYRILQEDMEEKKMENMNLKETIKELEIGNASLQQALHLVQGKHSSPVSSAKKLYLKQLEHELNSVRSVLKGQL